MINKFLQKLGKAQSLIYQIESAVARLSEQFNSDEKLDDYLLSGDYEVEISRVVEQMEDILYGLRQSLDPNFYDKLISKIEYEESFLVLQDFRRKLENVPEGPLQSKKRNTIIVPSFELNKGIK